MCSFFFLERKLGNLKESTTKFCDLEERWDCSYSNEPGDLRLYIISGAVVEKLLEYLAHKFVFDKYEGKPADIPDFGERIAPEIALEL